ncbi:MAG: hypothetical protein P4L45_00440 [Ignavibacteriaceae bacterium]|nr:hypothetical protein [Ignavibacteriaceae bacterium]
MKKTVVSLLLLYSITLFASDKFKLDDFSISLEQLVSSSNHIWVNSGYTTVNPKCLSVLGVNDFYSPPLGAKDFNLSLSILADSISITDGPDYGKDDVGLLYSGGTWYPDKIVRNGTYHHLKGNILYSFSVRSELIPLFGNAGFMEKVIITNRSNHSVKMEINAAVQPGKLLNVPLSKWGFSIARWTAPAAVSGENNIWQNGQAKIGLYEENKSAVLMPHETVAFYVAVIAEDFNNELPASIDFRSMENKTISAWQNRLEKYTQNIPAMDSNIPGLKDYYYRSIISGLVCIWENDKYLFKPHISTAGMDGGGTCSYLWDIGGYAPNMAALMLGPHIKDIAMQMVNIDLEKYYAYTLDGSGIGVKYSYSPFSFSYLVSAIFQLLGPDKELYASVKQIILNDEKREDKGTHLIDYGEQKNLLEMRGAGWEHVVVSPNAERIWCLQQLAEMGKIVGEPKSDIETWNLKAEEIKLSIEKNLWDKDKKWFASIYPNGFRDYVYSIQDYDALQAGACNAEMENVLLSHLREGAYLGKYGVSSVSAEDTLHYEVIDTDWSGGGAYTGDGPQLALCMYQRSHKELGWDILKRHFWMGNQLLYFPQEIYSDKPKEPEHKRANTFAGLTGAEAVLFGLVGFQTDYNGSLFINPQPVEKGDVNIKGFGFKGHQIDVELSLQNLKIYKDGKLFYRGTPKKIKIV